MNPFDPGYYNDDELRKFGFRSVGKRVAVARNCTIVGLENIAIGNDVRIDGFSTVIAAGQGRLTLGSHIHIGGYCGLFCGAGVTLDDFSGLSQGVKLYSTSDDYSGEHLTNPTVPAKYTGVARAPIHIKRHAIVGSGSVLLPGVVVGEGTAVGALSLVVSALAEWSVYFGNPVRRLRSRSRGLLALEEALLRDEERLV